jgi:hypothetical protein
LKQYLLSVCYPAGAATPPPQALDAIRTNVAAVRQEMQDAGAWVFAAALQPPGTASVVRLEDGNVLVTDGPFVESKELIGGICVIRAADLDEALRWGERLSRATTTPIEVRPIEPDAGGPETEEPG